MTTIIVNARAKQQGGDVILLELERDGKTVEMTTYATATWEELAYLILAQTQPDTPDQTYQRRITIEAHQETGIDPDDGEYQYWVVDDVAHNQLHDEAARDGYAGLSGWATWSGDEAAAWVEVNVIDLDSAKIALAQMARAITYLRDWRTK